MLHQYPFIKRCFIHGTELKTAVRQDGYKIRYRINRDLYHNYAYQYDRADLRKDLDIMDYWKFAAKAQRLKSMIIEHLPASCGEWAKQKIDIYIPDTSYFARHDVTERILKFLYDGTCRQELLDYRHGREEESIAKLYIHNIMGPCDDRHMEAGLAGEEKKIFRKVKEYAGDIFYMMMEELTVPYEVFGQSNGLNVGESIIYNLLLNDVMRVFSAQVGTGEQHVEDILKCFEEPVYLFILTNNKDIRIIRI